jgi:hypothetical protein
MHITSFYDLPQEVIPLILYHADIKGIIGLLSLDKKKTSKIQEIASKYLNELKQFYIPLIRLQQHYSSKQHLLYSGPGYDKEIMTNKVITGKILKFTNRFILAPALTDKEKKQMDLSTKLYSAAITLYSSALNNNLAEQIPTKLILELLKDKEPKDIILKPDLNKEYQTQMTDTSRDYEKSNYWFKENNKVDVTIFPITKFSLNFDLSCTLPEETKRKIIQSLDLANTFYQEISKNGTRRKLESTLDVNTLQWGQ